MMEEKKASIVILLIACVTVTLLAAMIWSYQMKKLEYPDINEIIAPQYNEEIVKKGKWF